MPPINFIGIEGTHGAGKTTFARALAVALGLQAVTYSRPTNAARLLDFDRASDIPAGRNEEFQWMALVEQIRAQDVFTHAVLDRTTIAFVAYYLLRCELAGTVPNPAYLAVALNHLRNYEVIFYLPPNPTIAPEDNGMRFVEHTARTDELIRQVARDFKIHLTALTSDGVDNRVEEAKQKLRGLGYDGRWAL